MKYLIFQNGVVGEYDDPKRAYAAVLRARGECVIYRGEAEQISTDDLREAAGLAKLDSKRLQFESERVHELIQSHVATSLVKAAVNSDEQMWSMEVDSSGVTDVAVLVTCRVKDITARRLFGEKRKTEAVRSRMTRACEQNLVSSLGWVFDGTEYSLWRDPVGKMHWLTITARLKRPRGEFEVN